jgi:feruloyl esterase
MREKVNVFYHPSMIADETSLKKAILLFDELHLQGYLRAPSCPSWLSILFASITLSDSPTSATLAAMRNRPCLLLSSLLTLASASLASAADAPRTCASLRQLALPNVTITVAQPVAAGMFTPPDLKPDQKVPPVYKAAPAFCRVTATLAPTPDSDIKLEVWLPAHGWNGKFKGAGNGGFAGYISYSSLAAAVAQGYATASTDTGHATPDADWALGHPEKIVDYGYRAIHEMTVDAKIITKTFYGADAKPSYFASCSNGGRQALMEAQRFPDDYDGILAGAPANAWVPLLSAGIKIVQTLDQAGYIPAAKIRAISQAVLAACDQQDGLKDGILNDPRQCKFDPATITCKVKDKDKDSDSCLIPRQADALKLLYSGAHDASGKLIFPGLLPGAEEGDGGWKTWITGDKQGASAGAFFVHGYFANMVYSNKDWDFKTANLEAAQKLAYEKTGDAMDAMNPDLKPFFAHGGKLILYHGWNDAAISPINSVNYYNSAAATVGNETADKSLRLYMVSGMQHCDGGPGATSFGQGGTSPRTDPDHDIFTSLVEWVENGKAPSALIATKYRDGDPAKGAAMTRPLCPYPQSAKYDDKGDPNSAASFACVSGN